jgi:hypothetical protein
VESSRIESRKLRGVTIATQNGKKPDRTENERKSVNDNLLPRSRNSRASWLKE